MLDPRRESGSRRAASSTPDEAAAAGQLCFRVLGPLEVLADGDPVTIDDSTEQVVLAALLVHANQVVPDGELESDVGGDVPAAVTELNEVLRAADPDAGPLRRDGGVLLRVGAGQLDELELLKYLEQGRRAGEDADSAGAARHLEAAWALWRGRPFGGVPDRPFLRAHRRRLEQLRLEVGLRLADAHRALGRATDSLPRLSELLADHDEDEGLRVRLARALQLDGQLDEARRVCRAGIEAFRRRGANAVQLEQLDHDLQIGAPVLDAPTAERQPTARSRAADREPLRLPPDVSDLTGREDAVGEVLATLGGLDGHLVDGARTVVLSSEDGKAGVGTTALAIHVAHRLRTAYPDGVLYVDLRGTRGTPVDPRLALGNVLLACGLPRRALPEDLAARGKLYREELGKRRILLVLDDAADSAQVRPLLPESTSAAAIVTSRSALDDVDGRHVTLSVLPPGAALELLTKVAGPGRLSREPELAARVVELCGGVPLALRVAGARAGARPHWDLSRLVKDLEDERRRLDVLDVGDLEARAGVALGYDALDETSARALGLLNALGTVDVPIWAAAAALGTEVAEADDLVHHLAATRLLESGGRDLDGQLRYRLHAVVKQIAWERTTPEDEIAGVEAVERVCRTYLRALDHASAALAPGVRSLVVAADELDFPIPEVERIATLTQMPTRWFGVERQNVVTLIGQAYDNGLDEMAWRLAESAAVFFRTGSHWTDWRQTHEIALRAARRAGNELAAANTLRNVGRMYYFSGRPARAWEPLRAALPTFRTQGVDSGAASCLRNFGRVAEAEGRFDEAADHLREALPLAERSGRGHGYANTLTALGAVERARGRSTESVGLLREAVEIYQRIGNNIGEQEALLQLAVTSRRLGRDDEAMTLLEGCRRLFRRHRLVQSLTETLLNLGELYGRAGRTDDALAAFDEAMKLFDLVPNPASEARVLAARGYVQLQAADETLAKNSFRQALALFRQLDMPEGAEIAARLADPGT